MESIMGVQKVLQLFYTYSRLQLNSEKNEFFSSSISKTMVEQIQVVTGFKSGTLPVRYLGGAIGYKKIIS